MNLDINVTSVCNLGCKYCSEGHNPIMPDLAKIENSKTVISIQDINEFIKKVHNKSPDEIIQISFWGGEPMMNFNFCLDLMTFYIKNNNIKFFFYTNGTYIKKYKNELKLINDLLGKTQKGESRLVIQISYDGKPINDIERLTKLNTSTTDIVKEAYQILNEINIQKSIKSTITPRTFHLIYESFLDVLSITDKYFPTPDTHSDYDLENINQQMNDLKLGLQKIAKYIYDNDLPLNTFGWFQNSRALCQAGINYFSINLDGTFSPCHGTMYEDHQDHEICKIYDENIINILNEKTTDYKDLLQYMNKDCNNCTALFCMKCPAGSYNLKSAKENNYQQRWTAKNINLCKVFKLNDIIHKSLKKVKDGVYSRNFSN